MIYTFASNGALVFSYPVLEVSAQLQYRDVDFSISRVA